MDNDLVKRCFAIYDELAKSKDERNLAQFSLNELIRAEYYAREEWEKVKKIQSGWNSLYDILSIEVVPERMEDEGEEGKLLTGIGRVELRGDIRVKTEDKDGLKAFLVENGWGDIVTETVNASTLKAVIREQMKLKGGKVPNESLVTITPFTRAVIVKG